MTLPSGPSLDFTAWTLAVVHTLREMLPDMRATRRPKEVTLQYRGDVATLRDDGETFRVLFGSGGGLAIGQHEEQTARVVARTLAAHFDDRYTMG